MISKKRALGLALASLTLIGAASLPAAAPIAADIIDLNISIENFQLQAPPAEILEAEEHAVLIEPLDVEHETPVAIGGLDADGLDLPELVSAVVDLKSAALADEDMRCLASAIYNEARGESIEGQLAVAQVVLNRVASDRWPGTICKVVYQRSQFSYTFDGRPDYPKWNADWARAEAIAVIAATNAWEDVTDDAVFFHATYARPAWRKSFERTRRIGQHIFYR